MRRSALLVALLVCASGTSLGAEDVAKAPYVEVGDCWSYRARNINNRGPIGDYEECVTFVDRVKNVVLAVV